VRLWLGAVAALAFVGEAGARAPSGRAAEVRLGARLFADGRFSTPRGDLPASCLTCHLGDEDRQGRRARADFLARSWIGWRARSAAQ
jgi:cytochrome c peroxidase